ncbi:uncharacterized protein BDR25DRAFT_215714 [Lindgomyces ingoldianus]|uniref:Uncharacterized protein n=1 Tax=Lindgomyces ingoldianus TaxID=673940 RepID=A0ACB6R553_9PLEO|nr:uncharacterized protein BDR25DRAFT_215714 [Lindgomyces ingoldianus]KAF2474281.1 hypothetical protein BDR25DRAFT_215714 [Lindgomyces ingoldianus]
MAVLNNLRPVPVHDPVLESADMLPKVSATRLLRASGAENQALVDIHELLIRLYIRNRNQHRRSHWFKSLCQFRKQLGLLIGEIENSKTSALQQRLRFWDERCIHQWYLTFTQLVAAGQFAVMGLVLMAATARICKISGITEFYEEIGSEDMKAVLRSVDEGTLVEGWGELVAEEQEEEEGMDMGVVIQRDE